MAITKDIDIEILTTLKNNGKSMSSSEMRDLLGYSSTKFFRKRLERLVNQECLERWFNKEKGRTEYRVTRIPCKDPVCCYCGRSFLSYTGVKLHKRTCGEKKEEENSPN